MYMAKILIVEDESNVRKLVTVNLVRRGHQILEAGNGQQALEHLYRQKLVLMILDIKLPDLSGWDILDRMTTVPTFSTNLPVVVMTASPLDPTTVLNKYPFVVDIIIKPFNTDRLITAVQRVLLTT